jgi:hypothetical protein
MLFLDQWFEKLSATKLLYNWYIDEDGYIKGYYDDFGLVTPLTAVYIDEKARYVNPQHGVDALIEIGLDGPTARKLEFACSAMGEYKLRKQILNTLEIRD